MPHERNSSSDLAGSELVQTFRTIGLHWIERASAEAELGFNLSKDLSAATSVPDAIAACQDWFSKQIDARAEGARQFMSDGQKLMDASARTLSSWTNTAAKA